MEIVIRERTLERIAYWLVILVLGVLLLLAYLRSPTCQQQAAANTTPAASPPAANQTENATANVTQNAASCTDGVKNQNESDVDCGGTCLPCAEGLRCAKNSDCIKAKCTSGVCNATVAVVKTDIFLIDVGYNLSNTTLKSVTAVTGLTLRIQNGNADAATYRIDAYVKTVDDKYYLDQGVKDPPTEPKLTYAEIDLPPIPAGQALQMPFTLTKDQYKSGGKSITPTPNGEYSAGDDFLVEVRLVDPKSETVLATAKKKVYLP